METTFVEYASLKFVFLYGSEGLVFLAVALYSAAHLRRGACAFLGAAGGMIGAAYALLLGFGWARIQWAKDPGVFDFLAQHEPLGHVDWARPLSTVLVAGALVSAHRSTRTSP